MRRSALTYRPADQSETVALGGFDYGIVDPTNQSTYIVKT